MKTLHNDLRFALRSLAKNPGFAFVAILTLALGIGASTAIFSVVDAVLLRALPYPNPQQIVRVWELGSRGNRMNLADPNFEDFRAQNRTLTALAEYDFVPSSVSGGSEPVRINIAEVSHDFFKALGVEPFRGRAFAASEQHLHGAPAVIVSYGYWKRYLGGSDDLSHLRLSMDGEVYPVVGVMPRGFDFPAGVAGWIPRELDPMLPSRTAHNWHGLGRLRDGVTVQQARADLDAIARRIKSQYGKEVDLSDAAVVPLADAMVGDVRAALLTLFAAVGLLLLVACANVAGLLLSRTAARRKEFAVRVALGLFAAWRAGGGDLHEALNAGSRSYSGTGASQRLRGLLVIGEIATTLVILAGAGLLGRSFLRLISVSPGLREENLISLHFSPPPAATVFNAPADQPDQAGVVRQIRFIQDALGRLRAIPGVESAGITDGLPLSGDLSDGTFLILNGQKPPSNFEEFDRIAQNHEQTGHADYCIAGEGYFRTAGIPLIRGRLFNDQDSINAPHVALISEMLAQQRWPNQDPIGQIIDFGNMDGNLKPMTIVGIVGDVRARGLNLPPSAIIYGDYNQRGFGYDPSPTIILHSAGAAEPVVAAARGIFHDLDPTIPVNFSTFKDELGGWLADRRFLLLLVGLFAAAALALAAVGIYGVVAFSVTRRTQEIGIRMALGAQPRDVLRIVLGEGARLTGIGVAIGLLVSFAVTQLMSSLLFGVKATDPITFLGVAVLLSLVALLACYIPARRAMHTDPMVALRYE